MHHVQKVCSVITKNTVSIRSPMWRWSRSKTGHCVGLEVAYIVLSLVFEKKKLKWPRSSSRWSGAGMFVTICDPPQEFDARGESTLTTGLYDTLSVPKITDMRILNWKNNDGHTCLCFGKFNTPDLLFFCSVPYVTVSVRIIARFACNLGKTRWTRLITETAKMIKNVLGFQQI